ncbi:MAG TPA: TIGR03619 family F420-dependent LLM class oxidoreductase [Alphaproteobacteria bacterium]|jgi:probable F420-dependent oxidoreductase|nr:TIGR03619 family F420-dependent LLM class oxidoreductase [Alphaproteobacteria bacterium]
MVKMSIGLLGIERLIGGDFAKVVDVVRQAEDTGIDMVSITDHVVMGEHLEKYPYGSFPLPLDYPWFEPMVVLGAIASATKTIRLSTGVLISPLRPAVLLAKQLATLDVMSHGRVTIGLGIGWQKEEYDASGLSWETRYKQFDEQVAVCRLLWSEAPASFHGKTVDFNKIHAFPRPVQAGGIPLWFGLAPTEKNFARIAEYGDGWIPMERDPVVLAGHVKALRDAFAAKGRAPTDAKVRVGIRPAPGSDLDAVLASSKAVVDAGADVLEFIVSAWCKTGEELPAFFAKLTAWRDSVR